MALAKTQRGEYVQHALGGERVPGVEVSGFLDFRDDPRLDFWVGPCLFWVYSRYSRYFGVK